MSYQSMEVIGNLTRDPEVKETKGDTLVITFSTAVNRSWKDRDGKKQDDVQYINWIAFGKQAETINQYIKKGHQVHLIGRYENKEYEKDGERKFFHQFIVEKFTFLNNRDSEDRGQESSPAASSEPCTEQQAAADTFC